MEASNLQESSYLPAICHEELSHLFSDTSQSTWVAVTHMLSRLQFVIDNP